MAIKSSSSVMLASTGERIGMAANAQEAGSIAKTPDYHLPWTGAVVEAALKKIMDLDLNAVGGVTILPSDSSNPVDIDTVTDPGNYTVNNITGTNLPDDLQGVTPVQMTVYTDDKGIIYQIVEALGNKWIRFSTDQGATWSAWTNKSTNSGDINTEDPNTPTPDPVKELESDVNDIANRVKKLEESSGTPDEMIVTGTAAEAQAMLNGTYDYDAAPTPAAEEVE